MKTDFKKPFTRNRRVAMLIAVWVITVGLLLAGKSHDIGLPGFLAGVAFLIFSMQWLFQQLGRKATVRR